MQEYEKALAQLKRNAEAVARKVTEGWDRGARRELGETLPTGLDLDHLPELIADLAAAASTARGDGQRERLVRTAVIHGRHRRQEGHGDRVVFREFHLLRSFLWEELKTCDVANEAIVRAILHLDSAITVATSASIHGFHLPENQDVDPRLIQRLLADWRLPL